MMANLAVYLNIAIALFVGWMLLGRLGGMGFSQEGKSYWMVKAAPITSGQLLASKFLVAYLPSVVLGWGFLLLISLLHPASQSILWFAIPLVALSIASNAGINLAFGVVGVRLDWEDPRQMMRGGNWLYFCPGDPDLHANQPGYYSLDRSCWQSYLDGRRPSGSCLAYCSGEPSAWCWQSSPCGWCTDAWLPSGRADLQRNPELDRILFL